MDTGDLRNTHRMDFSDDDYKLYRSFTGAQRRELDKLQRGRAYASAAVGQPAVRVDDLHAAANNPAQLARNIHAEGAKALSAAANGQKINAGALNQRAQYAAGLTGQPDAQTVYYAYGVQRPTIDENPIGN